MSEQKKYTFIDLFAGCGGLSLGLEQAAFEVVFMNEIVETFGTKNGKLCLKLNLSSFISLGSSRTPIYRIKMQPGELISNDLMVELYEQRI